MRGRFQALCVSLCVQCQRCTSKQAQTCFLLPPRIAWTVTGVSSAKMFPPIVARRSSQPSAHARVIATGSSQPSFVISSMLVDSPLFLILDMYCEASIFRGGGVGELAASWPPYLMPTWLQHGLIPLASEQMSRFISFARSCVEQAKRVFYARMY